jgi:hypothetical protein
MEDFEIRNQGNPDCCGQGFPITYTLSHPTKVAATGDFKVDGVKLWLGRRSR